MKKAIILACLCGALAACENVEKKAALKLDEARAAFEAGNYNEAKMQIDSIKLLYPKAFDTRRQGIYLMQEVELKEQEKTVAYLDSMLAVKQQEFEAMKGKFVLEKIPPTSASATTWRPRKSSSGTFTVLSCASRRTRQAS